MGNIYQDEVLADSPSFYMGDINSSGVPLDISGNSTVITPNGSVSYVATRPGDKEAPGWLFPNAAANFLSAADGTPVDLGNGPFTIEYWAVVRDLAAAHVGLMKGTNNFELSHDGTAFGFNQADVGAIVASTIAPKIGVLYHIIWRRTDSTTNTVIINGADVTGAVTSRTLVDTATVLNIGRYNGSGGALFPWNGMIAHVALYKAILSDQRCIDHWNVGNRARIVPDYSNFPKKKVRRT